MCRRNQMNGCCMAALGVGILLGQWIESAFLCLFSGMVLITIGFWIIRRK